MWLLFPSGNVAPMFYPLLFASFAVMGKISVFITKRSAKQLIKHSSNVS